MSSKFSDYVLKSLVFFNIIRKKIIKIKDYKIPPHIFLKSILSINKDLKRNIFTNI